MNSKRFPVIITDKDCQWAEITYRVLLSAGSYELALELADAIKKYHNMIWSLNITDLELKIKDREEAQLKALDELESKAKSDAVE